MRGVDLGNQQRHIMVHAMVARIADYWVAGAREVFFRAARDGGIERGENEVAI
jgi:hypothetical protein